MKGHFSGFVVTASQCIAVAKSVYPNGLKSGFSIRASRVSTWLADHESLNKGAVADPVLKALTTFKREAASFRSFTVIDNVWLAHRKIASREGQGFTDEELDREASERSAVWTVDRWNGIDKALAGLETALLEASEAQALADGPVRKKTNVLKQVVQAVGKLLTT